MGFIMLGFNYKGKNSLDTNQKLIEYREYCAESEILQCINRYLGKLQLVDANGVYLQEKVHGEFPCDLSSFSVIAIRRILSKVGQKVRHGKVTLNYSYSKRTMSFTIKLERT